MPVRESDRKPGPYPYYGASGVVDHVDAFLFDGEFLLVSEDGENLRTRQTPVAFMASGQFWVNNHAHILSGNSQALTRYLHYAIQAIDVAPYLTGAVMPKLSQLSLNRIEVPTPPLAAQEAITELLGALDGKIELNRRMADTLEATTRALFKSWFVDFDPVRAKAEGYATGLPEEVVALFPAELNGERDLPAGWSRVRLGDVIELAYGKALPKEARRPGDIPVYGSGGENGFHHEPLVSGPGIIVGRKGTVGSLKWAASDFFPIDTVFYIKCRQHTTLHFIWHVLRRLPLNAMNTDAAVPGLNRENAYRLLIIDPGPALVRAFTSRAEVIQRRSEALLRQDMTLCALRDTLLPKLVSGELQIGDAKRVVAAVA